MDERTPRERRRARTAQAILDAALELIAERGVSALSMREIAQRIEYSPSGLYEYYASKDEILDALAEQGLTQLDEQMGRSMHATTAAQQLFELGVAYQEFACQHAQLYQLIFNHVARPVELQTTLEQFVGIKSYGKLYTCIATGVAQGAFILSPQSDINRLAYQFWALWHGLALLRLTRTSQVEGIDEITRSVLFDAIERLRPA